MLGAITATHHHNLHILKKILTIRHSIIMLNLLPIIMDLKRPSARIGVWRGNTQRIADNYRTLDQVTAALAQAGLESSNFIVGVDFTKSNEWTASTRDQDIFSFYPEEIFCNGFEEVLARYREIVSQLRLAGPTSFAPIIEMAMTIVEQSGGQYHVLLIIADGQVTRSADTQNDQLSPQEQKTIDAIVKASKYPFSIVLVVVGDGPWDMMREFDDYIPPRAFDNFQFVNFTEIMSKNMDPSRKQAEFALSTLMEIPSQYKATIELGLLGRRKGNTSERVPLPPPLYGTSSFNTSKPYSRSSSFQQNVPPYFGYDAAASAATGPSSSSLYDHQVCPICLGNPKDMAFWLRTSGLRLVFGQFDVKKEVDLRVVREDELKREVCKLEEREKKGTGAGMLPRGLKGSRLKGFGALTG
ncbi:hypothetical protein CRYUN_Cryun04dG0151300 [Craigia yunnanensis]